MKPAQGRKSQAGRLRPAAHGWSVLLLALGVGLGGCQLGESFAGEGGGDANGEAPSGSAGSGERAAEAALDELDLEPEIRRRLEAAAAGAPLAAAGERLHASRTLPEVYDAHFFEALWIEGPGLSAEGSALLGALREAEGDGLDPAHYHVAALDSLLPRLGGGQDQDEVRRRVDVDLLLTDAFLLFGAHLLHGRLDPVTVEPAWTAQRNGVDMAEVLLEALGEGGVEEALERLRPAAARYGILRRTFAEYRRIAEAGGWGEVPAGPVLDPGMRSERVVALRSRLAASGDWTAAATGSGAGAAANRSGAGVADVAAAEAAGDPELYDDALAEAVRAFQRRHGLEPDARVGPATRTALNVAAEARLRQLVVNLERWRWLPRELGPRYILVNIPGFSVSVVDDGDDVLRMRAIVGRAYRQTPVFSGRMTYLALAPFWHVPPGIARNDMLPRIRENPGYVAEQRMTLFDAATNRAVDPATVQWAGMTGEEFNRRFRLRQEPGPLNALGSVKFMFPNRHNVYLHDTPGRELFDRAARDFSSGCIRIERPLELARHLLRDDPGWNDERIDRVLAGGREQAVTLPHAYDVHIQYWTAWVERDGTLHFRDDIYDRDERVRRALAAPPPAVR